MKKRKRNRARAGWRRAMQAGTPGAESGAENKRAKAPLAPAELAQTVRAIREGQVDALFLTDSNRQWLFTLKGADAAYRLLIENMSEGAVTVTAEGAIGYANRSFAEMLGRPLHRVIGARLASCFAPEDGEALRTLLSECTYGKRSVELNRLTQSGARVPTLLSANLMPGNGLPGAVCLIATDLTEQKRSEAVMRGRQRLLEVLEEQKRTEESLRVSLETLQLHDNALGAISQGVIITDPDLRVMYVNAAFEATTGYSRAELEGNACTFLQGPASSTATPQLLAEAIRAGQPFHGELQDYRKDGTSFWSEIAITPVFNARGMLTQFVAVQRDVTAHRMAEEQLILAAKVFEQSNEGIVITDRDNRIVKVNPAFTAITGYSEAEVKGCNPSVFLSGNHDPVFFGAMWKALGESGRWNGEVWNRRKNGERYLLSMSISRVSNPAGQPTQYIASFSDVTQRKEDEAKLQRMAHFDPLTGVPNRTLLGDRATHAFGEASRNDECIAMMFIDLDRFKNINDSLGHRIGDELLVAVAERIRNTVREQDTVARVGGDEFVLLLPDTNGAGAAHLAQKLVCLLQAKFQVEEHELLIGSSIGIALYPGDGDNFETLCKCADAAMYRAKQDGGNTFHFYTEEIQARSERLLSIENALRYALDRGEMQIYYQPQKSLCGRSILGAEALLRWMHPTLGLVPPAEFIPIAESSGLINTIGEWVLRTTVRQIRCWRDADLAPLIIAVNLSAAQFRQRDLLEVVCRILDEAGVPPQCLELELTENVALKDPEGAIAIMDKLNARGIRMSIDDFGTGYSSLSYLKRFKAYRLKIDQSFVRDIIDNAEDQAIVTAIISMANSLGMHTIAEGVETAEQMEFLRATGCDELQGYWFSRPLPADQFTAFMEGAS